MIDTQMEDRKMKKIITAITCGFLVIVLSSAPARADRKTMEGFLLGTGVAILGSVIIHEINRDNRQHQGYHIPPRDHHRRDRFHKSNYGSYKKRHYKPRKGHWQIERVWVAPVYERKWNPGHYNRRGKWVEGRYERFLVCEGYYKKERVWVRY